MRLLGGVMGVVAFLLVVFGMISTTSAQDEKVINVTAKDLLAAYKGIDNEPDLKKKYKEGDDKYKGQVLEITGVMSGYLGRSNNIRFFRIEAGTGVKAKVYCAFGNQYDKNLLTLTRTKQLGNGTKVVVRGTCAGRKGADVTIDDCVLVDPPFPK